jgi:hypothetical protein
MKKIDAERYTVTHDHVNKRTRVRKMLRDHIIQEYPWIDGILNKREAISQTNLGVKTPTTFSPVCLKRG